MIYSPHIVSSLDREIELKGALSQDKRVVFRQREMEYQQFLREMQMRVQAQPLLLEETVHQISPAIFGFEEHAEGL